MIKNVHNIRNNTKNKECLNLGLLGFTGFFLLSSISYFTHLFFPHNFTHNLIILFLGILSLFIKENNKNNIEI